MKITTKLSIKHKLTLIIMLTSTTALLFACVAFFGYEIITFRSGMAQKVAMLAEVLGANCRAALVFEDSRSAEETLAALASERNVVAAKIFTTNNAFPLAVYFRKGEPADDFAVRLENGRVFLHGHLYLSAPILLNHKPIGTIALKCDLLAMTERLQRYAGIVLIVMLASTTAAFLLASQLQPMISTPILHLVETAKTVSQRKDYTVRASKKSDDELGLLMDSFNEMLEQIHRHEETLNASLREKELLLKEVHHRVKNNLQVVSSLLHLQSDTITEPATLAMFSESRNRIKSMALIHEKLYQSEELARIDFAEYVRNLTNYLYRSYTVEAQFIQLVLEVEAVHLNIDAAIPCGLILNELVSNSLKYAFPQKQKGEIRIRLLRQESGQLLLLVQDDGVGLPKDLEVQNPKTLGLNLIRILAKQLHGEMSLHSENGTAFRLTFPGTR